MNLYPIVDLHCDLLCYLEDVDGATPDNTEQIGCAIPYLREGNVKLQFFAVSTATEKGSVAYAEKQRLHLKRLLKERKDVLCGLNSIEDLQSAIRSEKTGVVVSIENASGLLEDGESLDIAFTRLERIIEKTGPVLYISFTHHDENRFGGGNYSGSGLKDDGKVLLEYLHNQRIAVDMSHTSDALAHGIFEHIEKKGLDIQVMASHSNFRKVFDHPRNLPDDIAKEIISRDGVIGMNFLRAFLHPNDPGKLAKHIQYGLEIGAKKAICFGADFFCVKDRTDTERIPFFFKEHANAGMYQKILDSMSDVLDNDIRNSVASENAMSFISRIWD